MMELRRISAFPLFCFMMSVEAAVVSATTFTFRNYCPYTVWVALSSTLGEPRPPVSGLELQSKAIELFDAPAPNWQGMVWARTGCGGSPWTCETGDCGNGGTPCAGLFTPPVTVIDFDMGGGAGDAYDVNLGAGFNVPVAVVPTGGDSRCKTAVCSVNLNGLCPVEGQVKAKDGRIIGCKSACGADQKYCCNNCGTNDYTEVFKKACPAAISYQDDPNKYYCNAPNYDIVFCP